MARSIHPSFGDEPCNMLFNNLTQYLMYAVVVHKEYIMTTKQVYDAKLSTITSQPVVWKHNEDGTVEVSFHVDGQVDARGRKYFVKRFVLSRYFSNHSVDTVRYNNQRYLIDSQVELVEAP